jgi:hypothetical protein
MRTDRKGFSIGLIWVVGIERRSLPRAFLLGIENEVHFLGGNPDHERIQRIVLTALWSEPVREPEEVFLVDRVPRWSPVARSYLQGRQPRVAAADRLALVCRPVGTAAPSMEPRVQVREMTIKGRLVCSPRQPVHAGCGIFP